MEMQRKIGLFFGGKSFEHEVSLRSMKSIYQALDRACFEPILFPVSKEGKIYSVQDMSVFESSSSVDECLTQLSYVGLDYIAQSQLGCAVSTMHGAKGENGAFQGLFEILEIPYVGPGILGSALAMDKEVSKRLLEQAGIPIVPYTCLRASTEDSEILGSMGWPCFVKAASLGSSVGVYKCHNLEQAKAAVYEAFQLDVKVMIEKAIQGREIEIGVLGHNPTRFSVCGEVIPHHEFYSYEAKYVDDNGASFEYPAKNVDQGSLQQLAGRVCQTLEIEGMARVDLFYVSETEYYVNEVNTLPGFTSISMYPKLFEAMGLSYTDLISELILHAEERHRKNAQLQKTLYANL